MTRFQLFQVGQVVKQPLSLIPACGLCGLYKNCQSPKMPVDGEGRRKILVVAEAPGRQEDEEGRPLVGPSGRRLRDVFAKYGVQMRRDCWLTNSLICRPTKNTIPDAKMIDYCRPNLIRTIQELKPKVILLLGGVAVKSLIDYAWKDSEDVGGVSRWVGWQIPWQKENAWICTTYHPSYVLRTQEKDVVVPLFFDKHIREAVSLQGRPWREVPDYRGQVEVILKPGKAAKVVQEMTRRGGVVAFDYEANMLKPDSDKRQVVSCSLCWRGTKTIAFPWLEPAVSAVQEFLRSPNTWKVASNCKYEERWTRRVFGHGVRNWAWDTMLASHVLDNRPGINSIKFQAFVRLGMEDYDSHIKPYLESKVKGGNEVNRIQELDSYQLLLYNGLDSLLEYKVAKVQARELGIPFTPEALQWLNKGE